VPQCFRSNVRKRTQLLGGVAPHRTLYSRWYVAGDRVESPLRGRSVLIVEDEPLIALEVHDALRSAGASVLAATNTKEAMDLIGYAQICAAIVDVDLGGDDCSNVCAALTKRAIPFMFYTGYSSDHQLQQWRRASTLSKPALSTTIIETVAQLTMAEHDKRDIGNSTPLSDPRTDAKHATNPSSRAQ
jgi:CheY-like chemotaxis protein